jgi:hypothetical protein
MSKQKEYRGPILEELKGKKYFECECCCQKKAIIQLDPHHINPQLAGTDNERSNLALLCSGCHQTLHRIAATMAGKAKGKRPASEVAEEFALTVNRQQFALVAENILRFASIVAQAIAQKKARQIEGGDVDTLLTLPPRQNALFKRAAKTMKDAKGRPLGKERVLQVAIASFLLKHYPDLQEETTDWLNTEVLGHPKRPDTEPLFMAPTRL